MMLVGAVVVVAAIAVGVVVAVPLFTKKDEPLLSDKKLVAASGSFVATVYKDTTTTVKPAIYQDNNFVSKTYKIAQISQGTTLQGVDLSGMDLYVAINDVATDKITHIGNYNFVYFLQKLVATRFIYLLTPTLF